MPRRKVYVYSLSGPLEALQSQAVALGQPLCHWIADPLTFRMGDGIPQDWSETGALFGPQGELRWWREGAEYRNLLLTETPIAGFLPLPGQWEGEEQNFFLHSLDDRRLRPSFSAYPGGGREGCWRGMVYYRDGVPLFISPRALMSGKGDNG
jgi:hypothetical protein